MLIDAVDHVGELVVEAAVKGAYIGTKIAKLRGSQLRRVPQKVLRWGTELWVGVAKEVLKGK